VLEFHRFKEILAAAQPAKEQLQRQLERVLASQTAETLPSAPRTKRLAGLKRLMRRDPA
jgi:3-phenylpropionate/cinnamic acid dioxygenase small subunit